MSPTASRNDGSDGGDETSSETVVHPPLDPGLIFRRVETDHAAGIPYYELGLAGPSRGGGGSLQSFAYDFETLFPEPPPANAELEVGFYALMAARLRPDADVERIDNAVLAKYVSDTVAVAVNVDWDGLARVTSVRSALLTRLAANKEMARLAAERGGRLVDTGLALFAADSAKAAAAFAQDTASLVTSTFRLRLGGLGIHVGSLLALDGTDIHWGDAYDGAAVLARPETAAGVVLASVEAVDAMRDQDARDQAAPAPVPVAGAGEDAPSGEGEGEGEGEGDGGEDPEANETLPLPCVRPRFVPDLQEAAFVVASVAHDDPDLMVPTELEGLVESNARMAVLATDLDYYARMLWSYGPLDAAALVVAYRAIVEDVCGSYSVSSIAAWGDNVVAVFVDPVDAVSAAMELEPAFAAFNARLEVRGEEAPAGEVVLGAAGVAYGSGVYYDEVRGRFLGSVVDTALGLAEKVRAPQSLGVAVDSSVYKRIRRMALFQGLSYEGGLLDLDPTRKPVAYHLISGPAFVGQRYKPAPGGWPTAAAATTVRRGATLGSSGSRFVADIEAWIRGSDDPAVANVNRVGLDRTYVERSTAVLAIGLDCALLVHRYGVSRYAATLRTLTALIAPITAEHGGEVCEVCVNCVCMRVCELCEHARV